LEVFDKPVVADSLEVRVQNTVAFIAVRASLVSIVRPVSPMDIWIFLQIVNGQIPELVITSGTEFTKPNRSSV